MISKCSRPDDCPAGFARSRETRDAPQMRLRRTKVKRFFTRSVRDGRNPDGKPGDISSVGEPLLDLPLVHEHYAFGVSDLIDDEAQLEEATRALQRLDLRLLHGTAPLRVIGVTVHVPPDCPIQTRSPSIVTSVLTGYGAATGRRPAACPPTRQGDLRRE